RSLRLVHAGCPDGTRAKSRSGGDCCAETRRLLRDILKDEWGFRGFVVSDFFTGVHDGVKAARAGLDLEMPMTRVFGRSLRAAVEAGPGAGTAGGEGGRRGPPAPPRHRGAPPRGGHRPPPPP